MATAPTRLSVPVLRSVLLWVARELSTGACPNDGPVSVHVVCQDGSAVIKVDPVGTEGTRPPDPADFVPTARHHADLLRAFLAPDERRIVAELAAGPVPLKGLVARLKIKRSRCATLAGNLRDRGVVRVGDRGYELTAGPWGELAGVAPAAAV